MLQCWTSALYWRAVFEGSVRCWLSPGWWSSFPCWIIPARFCPAIRKPWPYCFNFTGLFHTKLLTCCVSIVVLIMHLIVFTRRVRLGEVGEQFFLNQMLLVAVLGWLFQVRLFSNVCFWSLHKQVYTQWIWQWKLSLNRSQFFPRIFYLILI